ncbi:MAG: hypothetical protein ACRCX8_05500 [Sarcina sp.]
MNSKRCREWFDEIVLIIFTLGLVFVGYTKHKDIVEKERISVKKEVYFDNMFIEEIKTSPSIYEYYEIPKTTLNDSFKAKKHKGVQL